MMVVQISHLLFIPPSIYTHFVVNIVHVVHLIHFHNVLQNDCYPNYIIMFYNYFVKIIFDSFLSFFFQQFDSVCSHYIDFSFLSFLIKSSVNVLNQLIYSTTYCVHNYVTAVKIFNHFSLIDSINYNCINHVTNLKFVDDWLNNLFFHFHFNSCVHHNVLYLEYFMSRE